MSPSNVLLLALLSISLLPCYGTRIYSFEMHHRYSEHVKKLSLAAGRHFHDRNWPIVGSFEYYAQLAHRDRLFHGRKLAESDSALSFSNGNETFRMSSLAYLHYATVSLGTPALKFLVALDTGSDLFWVPCQCDTGASTAVPSYSSDFEFSIYSPEGSSTSKKVACNNTLCTHHSGCQETLSHCPYSVSYVSSETSTSGILLEDVLHLKGEDSALVKAYITFGCGQVQTGSFVDVAAPDGLFGLGLDKIAVPSILSREGYMADSFSMCFGGDGTGRINFGDKGSHDQEETPFNVNPLGPAYNVTMTQIRVGTTQIELGVTALVDSGTSFTYMVDPYYTRLSESFHSQAKDKRHPADPRIPFQYCYEMRPDANTSLIPAMSITMKGGGQYTLYDPIIVIPRQLEQVYCLAVIKSQELNIIGQNFMTGYRIVFDREKLVLGWKKFDCYDIEASSNLPSQTNNSADVLPAVAAGLTDHTTPKSAGESRSAALSFHCKQFFTSFVFHLFFLTIIDCMVTLAQGF